MAKATFHKIATVPAEGLTAGAIYFETSTKLIKVAKSATEVDSFGGNISDATYEGNILTITKVSGAPITLNFSDIASASAVMAVFEEIQTELTRVEGEIATQVGAAKTELIGTSADTSNMNTINAAKKYAEEKVAAIPAAIVYKADGTTITQSGDGPVTFSVGTIATAKVNGLDAALANKVDKEDGKGLSTNDFDAAAKGKLDGIEAGAQVNKIESIKVNGSPLSISAKAVEIPNADAEVYGVITENRVKTLAGEVAGSVYKVKGTKATIAEVLAVGTAAVGDVYNVTAAFTLNGQKFPAGTNVVFVGPGEEGEPDPSQQAQWDALGGTVDLTPYETTAHATATYATKETVTALDGRVDTVEGQVATKAEQSAVDTLSDEVDANTAAISVLKGAESSEGSVAHTAKGIVDREIAALDLSNTYEAKGAAAGVKAVIDAYTVNGIAISTNPTLNGNNVQLSGSYVAAGEYVAPAIGDKIDVAIAKLAKGVADAAAGGVQSVGGATGAITLKAGGANNGDINLAMSGQQLQATIVGLKSAAFAATTAFDAAGAATQAETKAKAYADSLLEWAEFE